MGILRTTIALTGWGSLAGALTFVGLTRNSKIRSVDAQDYIFHHTLFARLNPNQSPVTQDLCVRRVALGKIKPELLEKDGALVQHFCAGVWSGIGYAIQRRYLERKYRGPKTAHMLWEQRDLKNSEYEVGTLITDHFEVVAKTPESIIVRCGDSPSIQDVRASDGLFEMTAEIKKDEGVAEFGLKSVFFNGLAGDGPEGPMPWHIQWLHQLYDKVLMESAIRNVSK